MLQLQITSTVLVCLKIPAITYAYTVLMRCCFAL